MKNDHLLSIRASTAQFALLALLFVGQIAQASERSLDFYFKDISTADDQLTSLLGRIQINIDETKYEAADLEMDALRANLASDLLSPSDYARILSNAGIVKSLVKRPTEGMLLIEDAVSTVEEAGGVYDEVLIDMLTLKGVIASDYRIFDEAKDSFRRAQHIAHRHDGVYTRRQLDIIDMITEIDLSQRMNIEADREQRFSLKINEQVYGQNSEELLPVLEKLGAYFANRGETIPLAMVGSNAYKEQRDGAASAYTEQYRTGLFRESIELYERAIAIIEDNYGPNDLRLVAPLRGLASARLKQRTARRYAEDAMERMVGIVESNPATDVTDHARALVDLGDTYTITSDNRATERYMEAWHLLDAHPELDTVKNDLFGSPQRLYPDKTHIIPLNRLPSAADGDTTTALYADVEFSVISDGRVSDVKVLDGNVPNQEKNYLRQRVRSSKYRPRIVDGELVQTEGLLFHQIFEYVGTPQFETGISIEVSQ